MPIHEVVGEITIKDYTPLELQTERAYLVGLAIRGSRPLLSVEDSLDELSLLADTAGVEVVGRTSQRLERVDPKTFVGSGKIEEVKATLETLEANLVLFDDELSPRHQRELEKLFGEAVKVLDRSALILDIFAQHASTHEGRLQVELAQYEYLLPRLTRQWTHLERQAGGGSARGGSGGVGLRGPGETQLEVDRREIKRIIGRLKKEIEDVRAQRSRQRAQRGKTGIPVIALVGYTNAGKSTLMKAITGAETYIANQLFATLDTTTRRVTGPSGKEMLFQDTVGFIQKLPTTLIAAFRATLEGIHEADVIVHVVDVSHPNRDQQIETVEDTLAEIDVPRIPQILVLNKLDLLDDFERRTLNPAAYLDMGYKAVVCVSAIQNEGIPEVMTTVEEVLRAAMLTVELLIPYREGELISWIHKSGLVEHEAHTADGVHLIAHVPPHLAGALIKYQSELSKLQGD